jgi:DNA repair protein RadA/Sms
VVASFRDLILAPGTALIGELGLGGQLRPVGQLELPLQEAARPGGTRAMVPRGGGSGRPPTLWGWSYARPVRWPKRWRRRYG